MAILNPELETVISAYIDGYFNYLGVATPGIVVSARNVGDKTVAVTVKPAVHKLVESEDEEDIDDVEEFVPLQEVPVCWLVGRGIAVNAKLLPGDSVLLICLDRDPSEWRRTGQASEPSDVRLHDWAHCVAIPGLVPATSPFPAPSDAAALASKLDKLIGLIKGWTVVANDGGAALKALVAGTFTNVPALSPTPVVDPITTTASKVLKLSE